MPNARELMLEFIDYGYRTPKPERVGTKRRVARENAKRAAVAKLYADTPVLAPSRQARRKAARQAA